MFERATPDAKRSEAIRYIKALARELMHAQDDDAVMVTELACTEPGCPPVETVIALLRAGAPPRQLKVHKAIPEVTREDVIATLSGHAHHD